MANSTLSYGSSGDEVKKLQKALNEKGYSLDVDGKFGAKTQSAVKAYQQKNGLSVDGIVGKNTWNSLSNNKGTTTNNATKSTSTNNKTTSTIKKPKEEVRPTYKKSDSVISAENDLNDWENNKPSEYESKYSEEIESILNDILNRSDFSYNMNADPLYNQYKEQYIANGKKAMLDTMANATALTGGYGSSYASMVGNQSYNDYLTNLNNIALDLYDRAYSIYKDKGDRLIDNASLLRALESDDYEKYTDNLNDYYKNGEYLLDKLSSLSDAEYESFLNDVKAFESDRDYNYKKYLDDIEQQNFIDKLLLDKEQFNTQMAFKESEAQREQQNKDRDYNLALAKLNSSGKSSTSKSSSKLKKTQSIYTKDANVPKSYEQFVEKTGASNILTRREFNLREAVKREYGTYEEYLKEMYSKYGNE